MARILCYGIALWWCMPLFFSGCSTTPEKLLSDPYPWICYYGEIKSSETLHTLNSYKLAIIDPDSIPDPAPIQKNGTVCIGYTSLGEAEDYRWYWDEIKTKNCIIGPNPNWKGAYFIDPRNQEWKRFFIRRIIPGVLNKGYQGIFLDTIDTSEYLEWKNKKLYNGSMDAMSGIIREIRMTYPEIIIVTNNGILLLPEIAGYIDAALVESTYTTYDFSTKTYKAQDQISTDVRINQLKLVFTRYKIPILTLDYTDDQTMARTVIQKSSSAGFFPYVTDITLKNLPLTVTGDDK